MAPGWLPSHSLRACTAYTDRGFILDGYAGCRPASVRNLHRPAAANANPIPNPNLHAGEKRPAFPQPCP